MFSKLLHPIKYYRWLKGRAAVPPAPEDPLDVLTELLCHRIIASALTPDAPRQLERFEEFLYLGKTVKQARYDYVWEHAPTEMRLHILEPSDRGDHIVGAVSLYFKGELVKLNSPQGDRIIRAVLRTRKMQRDHDAAQNLYDNRMRACDAIEALMASTPKIGTPEPEHQPGLCNCGSVYCVDR